MIDRARALLTVPTQRMVSDDAVFAPNQQVLLSDLETEEREIESFKRFDYYFKPPANKPKVNFDIRNIVVAQRKGMTQSSSSSSLFYDEPSSASPRFNNGSTTPLMDDYFADMSLLSFDSPPGFSAADLSILANSGRRDHGLRRGDHAFVNGLLDSTELKSGLVD